MHAKDRPSITCGVMIATHNRRADLAKTLRFLEKLVQPPREILVCADGCEDGTEGTIRKIAPHVRLLVNPHARGSVKSRNQLMREARSDIMLSLDDDSYPVEPDFIPRVIDFFERDPELGVLTFPQRSDEFPKTLKQTDFGPALEVGSYTSSGSVIRRDLFLRLGGYMSMFFQGYEEPDFAVRVIAAGFRIRFEPSLTVRHHYTTQLRDELRTHQFHARNELWSVVMRCPLLPLPGICAFRIIRQLYYAVRRGPRWLLHEPRWCFRALAGLNRPLKERRPLSWPNYRRWLRLVHKPEPFS